MNALSAMLGLPMGRSRYQRPGVHVRRDVARPYYFVRFYDHGPAGERVHRSVRLGYVATSKDPESRRLRQELTLLEARAAADRLLAAVNDRNAPIAARPTLAAFVADFFIPRHFPTLSPGAQRKYRGHLDRHILPTLGALRLDQISALHVQDLLNQLAQDYAWATRADVLNVLSAAFTRAERWRLFVGPNPCRSVELGRKAEARTRVLLSPEQIQRLAAALEPIPSLLVRACHATGCRISEILALRGADLDNPRPDWARIERRWYRGDLAQPKTASGRRAVPLGPVAAELRALASTPDRFLFDRGDGIPLDDREILKLHVRPALVRLGLWSPGLGWHAFRRAAITEWQAAGASTAETARLAGHARSSMTDHYTLANPDRAAALTAARERLLAPNPSRKPSPNPLTH